MKIRVSRDDGARRWQAAGFGATSLLLWAMAFPPHAVAQTHPAERDTTIDGTREAAVHLARAGHLEEARDRLLDLRARHPGDTRVLADLLVVLGWLGADGAVRAHAEGVSIAALPAYAAEVVARAVRDAGDAEAAAELYATVLRAEPDRLESRIGLALSLAESGRESEGWAALQPLLADSADVDVAIAAGHVHRSMGDPLGAASWYERALERAPGDGEAYRGRALSLAELGATQRAVEQVRLRPDVFTEEERQQVEGDRAALLLRWIHLPVEPGPGAERPASSASGVADPYRRVDEALAVLEERVAAVPSDLRSHANRARFDRLVALGARGRADDVVVEVERLREEGVELPPYVLTVAGEAYLRLRRPREAAEYFRRDLAVRPGHVDTRISLFYALVEMEDFGGALAQIDSVVAEQPEWRWAPGLREPRENPDRVRADVTAHMARAFAGDLKAAERGLRAMADRAPTNTGVRAELASVHRFRGQPSRALEEAELGLALDSANFWLRLARAAALHDLREWRAAGEEIEALRAWRGDDPQVRRLAREHDLERGWALRIDGERGTGSGAAAVATDDERIEALLLSPRTAGGLRGLVRARRDEAVFDRGRATYERLEAGLRLDRRRGWLLLAGGAEPAGDGPVASGEFGLRHGDGLTASLSLETRSTRVPLQARLAGVRGWSAGLGVRRAWHEGRAGGIEVTRTDLDDGNERLSAYTSFEQRVATTPHLRVTGLVELYGSSNTRDDAPYFNPRRDLSPALGLTAEWLTWRSYERSFSQHLTLSGGGYWQDGYDMAPTVLARYQHWWALGTGPGLRYGVTAWSRTFDGNRESRTAVTASVEWRVR